MDVFDRTQRNFSAMSGQWKMVQGRDPLRFCVFCFTLSANPTYWAFGDAAPTILAWSVGTEGRPLIITRREIGDIICKPLWCNPYGYTFMADVPIFAYKPDTLRRYLNVVESYVSQFSPT